MFQLVSYTLFRPDVLLLDVLADGSRLVFKQPLLPMMLLLRVLASSILQMLLHWSQKRELMLDRFLLSLLSCFGFGGLGEVR